MLTVAIVSQLAEQVMQLAFPDWELRTMWSVGVYTSSRIFGLAGASWLASQTS